MGPEAVELETLMCGGAAATMQERRDYAQVRAVFDLRRTFVGSRL